MKQKPSKLSIGMPNRSALTTKKLAAAMTDIMTDHIGYNNAISQSNLFERLYGHQQDNGLKDWLLWEFAKRALHYLRIKTKCFVTGTFDRTINQYKYFVLKSDTDAKLYAQMLDRNIARMEYMKRRAQTAVDQKWYLDQAGWGQPQIPDKKEDK
jgi:hypothetical protein